MLTLTLDKPGAAPARKLQLSLNKGAAFKVTVAWQCDARHQDDIDIHGDPAEIWRPWVAGPLELRSIPSGHHQAEEAPEEVAAALLAFLE